MSMTVAPMPRSRSRARSPPMRSMSRWCCRAISARKLLLDGGTWTMPAAALCCSWTAMASIRPICSSSWSVTGSMAASTWSIPRKRTATMNPAAPAVHGFYALINWGAAEDPGGCRRLPPAVAARCARARAASCPSATASSRGSQADRLPARSASITNLRRARTASPPSTPPVCRGFLIEGLTSFLGGAAALRACSACCSPPALFCSACRSCGKPDHRKQVPGYPSLVVGLMTIGGVQLIAIGIVGEYIEDPLGAGRLSDLFCRRAQREAS